MSELHEMQKRLLDALGLGSMHDITRIQIDIQPDVYPSVVITRQLYTPHDAEPLREVIEDYKLMPKRAADTDALLAYHVGYADGQKARVDTEGYERTPVQGEFKIEAALKDAQFREYKDVRVVSSTAVPNGTVEFRDSNTGKLQGKIVDAWHEKADWFGLTEPEKPRLR